MNLEKRVTVRIDAPLAEALGAFMASGVAPMVSRQDAVRFIMRDWLSSRGYASLADQPNAFNCPASMDNTASGTE
ncbi:hypothetical protein JP75_19450 [Devosia riboflavina]|uniref:Uncharacterized protein n=1 Tax=Devosia riboflavina TaxID=46914 RepID=A0A087LYR7_9HYPH|nr:hypothetical protein JP75_19450 [Devosia riboflavina]